jgi:glyoxylase-like metal-dependent hydrolase (beta-lactamase superfamily II)
MLEHEDAPTLECHMFGTGHCLARENHLIRGGRRVTVQCHSLVALLRHPAHGWLLWDAGYAQRMLEETRRMPYAIYRMVTPLRLRPDLAVVEQIWRWQLTATDIDRIIISHFHADHIAGLRDFPQARLIASAGAYHGVAGRHGFSALRRGMIPALLPDDFAARAELLPDFAGPALPELGPTHDLFGDGSLVLVALPGHARGQMGMLARTTQGQVLFAADACWLARSIREHTPPHPITNLLVDDPRAVRATIDHLAAFAQARPDVTIIPSHCPETFAHAVRRWT